MLKGIQRLPSDRLNNGAGWHNFGCLAPTEGPYSLRNMPIVIAIDPATVEITTRAASSGLSSKINQIGVIIANAVRAPAPIQYWK
jgi:hypothetical protein